MRLAGTPLRSPTDNFARRYDASIYVRQKLEQIEQNAAPAISDRELAIAAGRSRRAARREATRENRVLAIVVPAVLAPLVCAGLVHKEAEAVDLKDLLADEDEEVYPTTESLLAAAVSDPSRLVHLLTLETALMIDSAGGGGLDGSEGPLGLADARVVVFDPVALGRDRRFAKALASAREAAAGSVEGAPGTGAGAGAGATASRSTRRHAGVMEAPPEVEVVRSPASLRMAAIAAKAAARAGRQAQGRGKLQRAPAESGAGAGASALRTGLLAPPVKVLPYARSDWDESITDTWWALHQAGNESGTRGKRLRPWIKAPSTSDSYEAAGERLLDGGAVLPSLKSINELGYVQGWSVEKAWVAALAGGAVATGAGAGAGREGAAARAGGGRRAHGGGREEDSEYCAEDIVARRKASAGSSFRNGVPSVRADFDYSDLERLRKGAGAGGWSGRASRGESALGSSSQPSLPPWVGPSSTTAFQYSGYYATSAFRSTQEEAGMGSRVMSPHRPHPRVSAGVRSSPAPPKLAILHHALKDSDLYAAIPDGDPSQPPRTVRVTLRLAHAGETRGGGEGAGAARRRLEPSAPVEPPALERRSKRKLSSEEAPLPERRSRRQSSVSEDTVEAAAEAAPERRSKRKSSVNEEGEGGEGEGGRGRAGKRKRVEDTEVEVGGATTEEDTPPQSLFERPGTRSRGLREAPVGVSPEPAGAPRSISMVTRRGGARGGALPVSPPSSPGTATTRRPAPAEGVPSSVLNKLSGGAKPKLHQPPHVEVAEVARPHGALEALKGAIMDGVGLLTGILGSHSQRGRAE